MHWKKNQMPLRLPPMMINQNTMKTTSTASTTKMFWRTFFFFCFTRIFMNIYMLQTVSSRRQLTWSQPRSLPTIFRWTAICFASMFFSFRIILISFHHGNHEESCLSLDKIITSIRSSCYFFFFFENVHKSCAYFFLLSIIQSVAYQFECESFRISEIYI